MAVATLVANLAQAFAVLFTLWFVIRQVRLQSKQTDAQTAQTKLQIEQTRALVEQTRIQTAQARLQSRVHLVNAFTLMAARWKEPIMLNARRRVCKEYAADQLSLDAKMSVLCMFFEEMGVYVTTRSMSAEMVWEMYSFEIEHYWRIAEEEISKFRTKMNDRSFYYHFEKLYVRMKQISKAKNVPCETRTAAHLQDFIRAECEAIDLFLEVSKSYSVPASRASQTAAAIMQEIASPSLARTPSTVDPPRPFALSEDRDQKL